MAKKENKLAKKGKGLWQEFKDFINKGNALMLAIGVVIGGAFSAIVNSVVSILTSLASWPIPGGLASLVTVLPAVPWNDTQKGLEGAGQKFAAMDFSSIAQKIGENAGITATDAQITYGTNLLNSNYTKHGATWVFNGAAIIDWGALINAFIAFVIIALVLFIVLKIVTTLAAKKAELDAKLLEEHYKKHPEDRPAPVEPGVPEPTETEVLLQIRDLLREQKAGKKE